MIPCNGCYSEGRAIREKRILVGKIDLSAPREMGCFDVFANFAASLLRKRSMNYRRYPSSTLRGRRPDDRCKTSTFTRRPGTRDG